MVMTFRIIYSAYFSGDASKGGLTTVLLKYINLPLALAHRGLLRLATGA
jgi:hypothetical protein